MLSKKPHRARPTSIEVATVLDGIADPVTDTSGSLSVNMRGEIVGRELEKSALRDEFTGAAKARWKQRVRPGLDRLAPLRAQFTEGFDTYDLIAADRFIASLS